MKRLNFDFQMMFKIIPYTIFGIILLISACSSPKVNLPGLPPEPTKILPDLSPEPTKIPPDISQEPTPKKVTITGWFTTIWNSEPHYSITDDQGQTTKLLLDDETAKPLGGPLELDRKQVTIVGELISDSPMIVKVLSVQFVKSD